MPVIPTKIVIEGENDYRQALSRINSALGTLKVGLNEIKASYAGHQNTMDALTAKQQQYTAILAESGRKVETAKSALAAAQDAQKRYTQELVDAKEKLDAAQAAEAKLRSSTSATASEIESAANKTALASKELEVAQERCTKAENAVTLYASKLHAAQTEQDKFSDQARKNQKYLDEATKATDKCATSIDEYGKRTTAAEQKQKQFNDAISNMWSTLGAAGLTFSVREVINAFEDFANSAMEFEQGMAGVRRTVGGSAEDITALGESFKRMALEMPITTTELGKIATTAGQLGIAREKVEDFTRVMAMLGTTTDLTAENAATLLAQFSNITGATDFERLGATVAELGDATATTASKVVEMSQGMAAAANIAGFKETDILALSAAVGSLGIEAQAGSTAMSTLISSIYKATEKGGEKLQDFATIAGMSSKAFADYWRKDAAGAFTAFIEGLGNNEKSAIVLLDELGINNARQTKAILGLSNAGELLRNTIEQSSRAWEDNTALTDKASIMYETTEAKTQMLKNSFEQLKIVIGDQMTPTINELADVGIKAFTWLAEAGERAEKTWGSGALNAMRDAMSGGAAGAEEVRRHMAELRGETEAVSEAMSGAENAMEDAAGAARGLAGAMDEVSENTSTASENLNDFVKVADTLKDGYNLLRKAQDEVNDSGYVSLDTISKLIDSGLTDYLEETEGGYTLTADALNTYLELQKTQFQIAYDEAENAAQKVVDAEKLKAAGYDITTMAIKDQLKAQMALLAVDEANLSNLPNASEVTRIGPNGQVRTVAQQKQVEMGAQKSRLQSALDAINAAQSSIDNFGLASRTLERDYNGKTTGKSSTKEKTQAEKELEAYKEAVAELDHLRAMDQLSEEEYYSKKGEVAEEYLQNNLSTRQKWEEELYSYQKGAYDRELTALDKALQNEEITASDYFKRRRELQDKYFAEGTAAWNEAEKKRLADSKSVQENAYRDELADLKYFLDMGIISKSEYYEEMARLRDKFLEEDSDAWRSANVAIYNYQKEMQEKALEDAKKAMEEREKALKEALNKELAALKSAYDKQKEMAKEAYNAQKEAAKEAYSEQKNAAKEAYNALKESIKASYTSQKAAAKEAYTSQKAAAKEAYAARKQQIKDELQAEKDRLNTIIAGIDAEVQARRRLREDEDQDAAIEAARKRLAAAEAQLQFARTDEDKAEWSKEIIRRQQALDEAIQAKEDTAFYRQKDAEKAGLQDQISAATEAANEALAVAESDYNAKVKTIESEYDAKVAAIEEEYSTRSKKAESDYNAQVKAMETSYNTKVKEMESSYKASLSKLENDYNTSVSNANSRYERAVAANRSTGSGKSSGSGGSGKTEKVYSEEVRSIARANDVDLGVAQDMYDANQMALARGETPRYVDEAAKAAQAAAQTVQSLNQIVQKTDNIVKNATANVVINQASGLTSGQVTAKVIAEINKMAM